MITDLICAAVLFLFAWYIGTRYKRKPKPSELDGIIQEQRLSDGLKFIQGWRGDLPVDVRRVTVILFYDDGKPLRLKYSLSRMAQRRRLAKRLDLKRRKNQKGNQWQNLK